MRAGRGIESLRAAGGMLALLFAFTGAFAAQQPAAAPAAKQFVSNSYGEHPAPAQPIPYSHKTHVARGLACQFCHANPDPGQLMTFPATSRCMTCHASISKDKPSIRQLAAFAKSGKPIPWVRVYAVTPGVTWTHRKHLDAGLKCENCHGQIGEMEAMSESTNVTAMAACIDCHAQNKAPTVCRTCHLWP